MTSEADYLDDEDELTEKGIERVLELLESIQADFTLIDKVTCASCRGSGRYDDTGSPKCASCRGRGIVPSDEEAVLSLVHRLSEVDSLDYSEAKKASDKIRDHMESLGLGWEGEYYWS